MPDSVLDLHLDPAGALLFGDPGTPPLWLRPTIEPEEVDRREAAPLDHLRPPPFPPRIGERPVRRGDDAGLLAFAEGFAPADPRRALWITAADDTRDIPAPLLSRRRRRAPMPPSRRG